MSSPLPPLANLYAFAASDPRVVEEVAAHLEACGRFAQVWRPHLRWVAASAPFPDGEPDGERVGAAGFAFAEGRHRILGPFPAAFPDRLDRLAQLVDAGGERLAYLEGDFGFIRFRPDGTATVVRSCGGLVPFYVWSGPGAVAVATLITDHARHLPGEVRIDPFVHAVGATLWLRSPDNRTFLSDVSLVPRGHLVAVAPTKARQPVRYWDPRPESVSPPTQFEAHEHSSRLRMILVERLSEELHPDGQNLLSLSGGVDSSSLAALAVRAAGRPLATVSLLPRPELKEALAHELTFIEPLLDQLGVEHRIFRPMALKMLHEYVRPAPDSVFPIIHAVLGMLPQLKDELGIRVLLGGEFADEMCGSIFTLPDWHDAASLPWLVRTYPKGFGSWRYPGRWLRSRLNDRRGVALLPFPNDLPAPVRAEFLPEYQEWLARQRRDYVADRRPWRYMNIRLNNGHSWVEMNWEAASLIGVRRCAPFISRAVQELSFSCHPSEMIGGPGMQTKRLIRSALSADVPHRNLYRSDKGNWDDPLHHDPVSWTEPLPAELASVVRHDWIPRPPDQLHAFDCLRLRELLESLGTFHRLRAQRSKATN